MYNFKQFVGELASPLSLAFLILACVAVLWALGRRRVAAASALLATAVVYLGSTSLVSNALLGPLEHRYPPLHDGQPPAGIHHIVVLGSGYSPRKDVPVAAALEDDGLVRIIEGIRLLRQIPTAKLLVSGGAPAGRIPSALGYAALARELGVDNSSLMVLSTALDTKSEARSVAALLGQAPFLMVTSAFHMPRAMLLMERAGAHPVPVPTGQLVDPTLGWSWRGVLPTSGGLRKTERALHEYLGLAAAKVGIE